MLFLVDAFTNHDNIYVDAVGRDSKAVKRECIDCHRWFIAPVQDKSCEMPDGSFIRRNDYVDTCPICDDDAYGLPWNLYFMEDLADKRHLYPYVEPYTVDV